MKESQEDAYRFIQGGGEMGELIRSFDWSVTSVGKPEQWPQSLRTTLGIVLHSAFPMFLFWGEDLICFYNDAFRPSLGVEGKHPAIGKKGREVWSEIWGFVGPMIEGIMVTGEPVWYEDQLIPFYRNGRMEDIYWTFSYSPAYGDKGTVNGVFVTCTETTGKVHTMKALAESEQRFRTMAEGTDILIATADETSKAVYFNKAWSDLTGRPTDDLLAFGWVDLVHPEDREGYVNIYLDAFKIQEPFTGEFRILNKNGEYRWLLAKGPPRFRADGSFAGYISSCVDITERKEAEKALEENEKRFRFLVEEASVPTFLVTGPEMIIELANPAMLETLGKGNSVIGKPYIEALPELKDAVFSQQLRQVYDTGKPYVAREARADLVVNGQLNSYYFDYTYKPLLNARNEVYAIMCTAINVTEQVQVRNRLEESGHQMRAMVESAPFPIGVYIGREMRVEFANQSILDIWGKGNDVIGKPFREVLPELDNQEVFQQLDTVFDTGLAFHVKNQRLDLIVNNQVRPYYFNYSLTPLFDSGGNVYGVMNTGVDLTELNLARLAIQKSEENLRNTILQAPVAMCILTGADHVVDIANDLMIELWGKPAEEVMFKPIFEGLPDAREQGLEKLLADVYTTGETFKASEMPVILLRNGKLEPVYQDFVYEPYRDGDGSILGILAITIDVTEQVLARLKIEDVVAERTRELATANNNLQRSNADLAQFAYIASHDLQEPVRKVSTFTQMLESNLGPLDARSQSYIYKIKKSSSRMLELIRGVLSYSELSGMNMAYSRVDLQRTVDDIITDLELIIEQKHAVIDASGLPEIDAIPLHMSQLFANLISNALKFTRPEVTPEIRISATRLPAAAVKEFPRLVQKENYWRMSVKDNGIGFSPEYANQIFSIFQRLHGRSEYEGTGIGLAMCQKIVQNHGGEIYAVSEEDQGSEFVILLPGKHV